jgi:hypothetical protein
MGDPLMRCASAMMLLFFITDTSLAAETVQPTRLSQPIVLARYSKSISPGIPLISNHRTSVHPLRGEPSKVSLTGSWYWRANCAVGSYRGAARIFQQIDLGIGVTIIAARFPTDCCAAELLPLLSAHSARAPEYEPL